MEVNGPEPILIDVSHSQAKHAVVPLEIDSSNKELSSCRFQEEVIVGHPPRIVFPKTVHYKSVSRQVGDVSESIFTGGWGHVNY